MNIESVDVFDRFWERTIEYACEATERRFINHFDYYVSCVVLEAEHRSCGYIPDVDSYLSTRRGAVGARICFVLLELGMDMLDEEMNHPVIEELHTWALDMIILSDVSTVFSAIFFGIDMLSRISYHSTKSRRANRSTTW